MKGWRALSGAVALGLALSLGAGCGGGVDAGEGRGVVRDVDAEARTLTLRHGDIPGLMKAMTMTFEVAPEVDLGAVQPGARVDFTVVEEGGIYTVTQLRPSAS